MYSYLKIFKRKTNFYYLYYVGEYILLFNFQRTYFKFYLLLYLDFGLIFQFKNLNLILI